MLGVVVKGGTNAGRRIIRKPKTDWSHECIDDVAPVFSVPLSELGVKLDGHTMTLAAFYRCCPICGTRRP